MAKNIIVTFPKKTNKVRKKLNLPKEIVDKVDELASGSWFTTEAIYAQLILDGLKTHGHTVTVQEKIDEDKPITEEKPQKTIHKVSQIPLTGSQTQLKQNQQPSIHNISKTRKRWR